MSMDECRIHDNIFFRMVHLHLPKLSLAHS
jgi:hypothetical protein